MIKFKYFVLFFIFSFSSYLISIDPAIDEKIATIKTDIDWEGGENLEELLDSFQGDDKKYAQEQPLIYWAIMSGQDKTPTMVDILLKFGADPNVAENGEIPLIEKLKAKNDPNDPVIEALLKSDKINVNIVDTDRETPLDQAIISHNPENIIKKLIEKGAKLESINKNGDTPLMTCIRHLRTESIDIFKYLLEKGANPNKINDITNQTILMIFIMRIFEPGTGIPENAIELCLDLLIKKGADINVKTKNNTTALELLEQKTKVISIRSNELIEKIRNLLKKPAVEITHPQKVETLQVLNSTLSSMAKA